ncbi:sterol desaturase/sphingolipid hydroxylase (fatty acid hydroxylase superfamily) [Dyadobacter jejuensis]|uniref:Sterol desaturase/sphingolipid hydroxylase (Fatty acid hydroxylase superfamily) n=1 Tax=Dyadobacter jejuensis TaxID=1082580 RepID=A0A316AL11_9BACT|nr:sterol desaturase family protein [Dyadobacter jejuensis]PWJ58182.1 sterol desaturase/sphingolipid hydroxylase (fatty acid hydroxylase superfamily) [Dyadobacter jejuensis]
MDAFINYFETISSSHRAAILIGGILLFWLIENNWPLFQFKYQKWKHARVNFFFTLTTILVNMPLAFLLLRTSDWATSSSVGIIHWLSPLPIWLKALIGLMVLDLIGAWLAHWIQHKVKFLWRFHIIHHADQQVDTTTANRHHPGESMVRFVFTLLAIVVSGAPMWLVFLYQSLSVVLSQFNHANIVLPRGLDRLLSWVLVTPNMHHIHHHYQQPFTDSNYGNIFAFWDRLLGTFQYTQQKNLIYGIDTHPDPQENAKIANLLKIPFQRYRPPVSSQKKDSFSAQ